MELRQYWHIARRRWLLIVIPTAVVLLFTLATFRPAPPVYNVGVTFVAGQDPGPAESAGDDQERYYNWLASEYVASALADWARGSRFAESVSQELAAQGRSIPPDAIRGAIAVDNARSFFVLSMTYGNTPDLAAMMDAAITVLTGQNAAVLPQLGGENARLVQLDNPVVRQVPNDLRSQFDLPLRVGLALAAGVALALLAEYLDPTIRERDDVEPLDLPLLGEIPRF